MLPPAGPTMADVSADAQAVRVPPSPHPLPPTNRGEAFFRNASVNRPIPSNNPSASLAGLSPGASSSPEGTRPEYSLGSLVSLPLLFPRPPPGGIDSNSTRASMPSSLKRMQRSKSS
jgi:hypothetical protein